MNYGDIRVGQVLYCHFTTRKFSTGAPITAASLAVSVYKNDSTTESTSGVTVTYTTGFDGRVGLVSVKIDTSSDGTFYAAGNDFSVVVSGGTADGVSIDGEVVGYFSIENRSALMPTTSGRKLDVSAGGEAGVDWANVGSPTTSLALTGTTIAATQKVDVDTIKTNPVANGGTVTFPTNATLASTTGAVGSVTGAVGSVTGLTASDVGAIKTKTDFLPSATAGAAGGVFIAGTNAATTVTTALTTTFTGNLTGNVGGNVSGSVASIATGGIAAASFAAGAIDAAAIATDAIDADALKADAVTEIQAGLSTLTQANVRSAVGLATANLDTQLAAIQADTDDIQTRLPAALVSGRIDASVGAMAANTITATAIATDAIDADALKADAVTEIQAGLSTLTQADIRTAVGLGAANLDTQLSGISGVTDKLDDTLAPNGSSPLLYQFTADALELAPTGGSAPTAADVADAVWDEARAGHVGAGSFGEGVASVQGNVTGSVGSVTGAVGSVTGAVGSVTGNVGGSVASVAAGGITSGSFAAGAITATVIATDAIDADALKADAVTEIQSGLSTLTQANVRTAVGLASANLDTQLSGIQSDTDNIQTRIPAALVSGRIDASVGAVAAGAITAAAIATDAIDADALAANGLAEIADAVWDELLAGHAISGSAGEALAASGAAGNPWAVVLEGSYTAQDLLRIVAGMAAGKTLITPTTFGASVIFRDVTDASDIITADMVGSERAAVTLAP